jgi:hypothetical protein
LSGRADKRYCNATCRKRAHRKGKNKTSRLWHENPEEALKRMFPNEEWEALERSSERKRRRRNELVGPRDGESEDGPASCPAREHDPYIDMSPEEEALLDEDEYARLQYARHLCFVEHYGTPAEKYRARRERAAVRGFPSGRLH